MAGFLQKLLLGEGPSQSTQFQDPNRVMKDFGTFAGGAENQLMQIIQQAMGGLGSFGPGFQGTAGVAAGKSVLPFLAQLFQGAMQTSSPIITQNPGSGGLLQTAVGGLAGGMGAGLGAKLFGGGGSTGFDTGTGFTRDFDSINS